MSETNIKTLVVRFKWRILFTNLLVFFESIFGVLIPLFIGLAINDLLDESFQGAIHLILLGLLYIGTSSIRRYYDARAYAGIYQILAPEMVAREQKKGSSVSIIIARTNLLAEFVAFLEWSLPGIVRAAISLIGTLVIISNLNQNVFYASLALLLLIIVVYVITGKINFKLNKNYNNHFEEEMDALKTKDHRIIQDYFKTSMGWKINLADLETSNYVIVMLGIAALLVYTPIAVIKGGVEYYGLVFSAVLYVFEYIGAVISLPDYIQQIIRLNEISSRFSE